SSYLGTVRSLRSWSDLSGVGRCRGHRCGGPPSYLVQERFLATRLTSAPHHRSDPERRRTHPDVEACGSPTSNANPALSPVLQPSIRQDRRATRIAIRGRWRRLSRTATRCSFPVLARLKSA